jgi:hypothetical protein
MFCRKRSLVVFAMIALQLLGGLAFASACLEPCPDDPDEASCPPACALCISCTHAPTAIVEHSPHVLPFVATAQYVPTPASSPDSQLAADIFHVPLAG